MFFQGYDDLVEWTDDYVHAIGIDRKSGGKSRLDNLSAACTNYLFPEDLMNPFHHCKVKRTRQALAKAASLVGENKAKAGSTSGGRRGGGGG